MAEEKKDSTVESPEGEPEEKTDAETTETPKEETEEAQHVDIDYEAELKKEREAREKAEKALAERRFKESEKKRKEETSEEEEKMEEEEKPLTASELESILARERQQTQKEMSAQRAVELAGSMSGSDAEKSLILEIFKNRTFPAHLSIEEQIEESYLIANRKKIIGENVELKRALKNRGNVKDDGASTHHDAQKSTKVTLPSDIRSVLQGQGFTLNNSTGRYEKKVGKGLSAGTLIADPKTGAITRQ